MSLTELDLYKKSTDREKLGVLRSELRRRLSIIKGNTQLLRNHLSDNHTPNIDIDTLVLLDKIINSGDEIDVIINVLT